MESSSARLERSLVKIFLALLAVIALLTAGTYTGVRMFHRWQERRLLAEANALVNEGKYNRATVDAQQVLQFNAQSAGANRVLADVGERTGARAAIDFRRRAAQLAGNNVADLLALARTAIRFGDAATAAATLDHASAAAAQTAEYHALRAELARLQHDPAGYENELARAARIEPGNNSYQLALALWHLNSAHADGVAELQKLQGNAAISQQATRILAEDALQRGESENALKYAHQLKSNPATTFADRLLLLSAMSLAHDSGTEQLLGQLQSEAASDPAKVSALLGWMNAHAMSREALAWMQTLPPQVLEAKMLPLAIADTFLAAHDWNGLLKFLRASNWGDANYLRAAIAARALRELGRPEESAQQWNEAVSMVGRTSDALFLLADMAQKWGWEKEALDLLWLAAKDPQKAPRILSALYNIYAAKGDTQELYRVLLHLQDLRPDDPAILNNVAQLSLLLNLNRTRGYELARQVHEREPRNIDYTATYAFALYSRGENKKALEAFTNATNAELHRPEIAAYYGIILAATGDWGRAREFLDIGEKANLLPEERALLDRAQHALAQR
ncbi:MAG: hypothetical protein JO354_12835 [Verrucomicrobia bacterium]|nr:hypothetical protein [Verrucomicrobiota bacterium]